MTEKPKTKILNDGTEVSQEAFGSIYGGGLKKAKDLVRKLKVGDHIISFTINDMSPLRDVIAGAFADNDRLATENNALRRRIAELKMMLKSNSAPRKRGRPRKNPIEVKPISEAKPRYSVKANSRKMERATA